MADGDIAYSGIDNLEAMRLARNYNAFLVSQVERCAHGAAHALDFGAGLGTFALRVRKHGLAVDTVETDPDLKAELAGHGFKVFTSTHELAEGQYDYIYSLNVMEHIEDDAAVFAELHRVTRPGGSMYVYVPALRLLWTSMDDKVRHFRRYTRSELERKVRDAGFTVERSRYCDAMGFFATVAFKLIGNKQGDLNPGAVRLFDGVIFPLNKLFDVLFGRLFGKNVYVVARK